MNFPLHVLAADSPFYEGECESLVVPTLAGQYGVQAGHCNTICAIVPGTLTYRTPDGETHPAAVAAGIMKIENGFVAESVAVTAGDAVNFGDAPQNAVVSKGDFSVTASELAGEGFGTGSSYSVAEGDFRVDVDSDVTVSEGFSVTAENVALETGGFTADGSATIRGEETVSITSSDDVTLAGEVLVTADQSVGISSSEGGIAMTGAVTVGDETTDENKAEVTLAGEILGSQPILLLDDVMSELDERRRSAVVSFVDGGIQTVVTTTNLGYFSPELLELAKVVSFGE